LTSSSAISCNAINGNWLTNLSKLQYLDISRSLTTQLSGKQPTLTSSSTILCSTINGDSLTNLSNLQYLDISSSLTTQLAGKQSSLTTSSNLSIGTLSCTSLTCTYESDTGSLSVQKGAIHIDGSSMWLYNSANSYGTNFAMYQGTSGNTCINSSSGLSSVLPDIIFEGSSDCFPPCAQTNIKFLPSVAGSGLSGRVDGFPRVCNFQLAIFPSCGDIGENFPL
jgi:hypothetical protein